MKDVTKDDHDAWLEKWVATIDKDPLVPKTNAELKEMYGHPDCEFCENGKACFCDQCVVPSGMEEVHHFYCHTCHAEHVGVDHGTYCPTCKRPWPKE